MPNKNRKAKKPMQRIVSHEIPVEKKPNQFELKVQYIIDAGNLIEDVQTRYTKIVHFKNKDWDYMIKVMEKYSRFSKNVKTELEEELYKNGATWYNARKTARLLMSNYRVGRV